MRIAQRFRSIYIIAAAGRVKLEIAYCDAANGSGRVIFSGVCGCPVIQRVVLNFGHRPTDGVSMARANMRLWFTFGNGKYESGEKVSNIDPVPGRLLANGKS